MYYNNSYTTLELLHSTLFSGPFFLQLTLNLHIRTLPVSNEKLLLSAISDITPLPFTLTIQSEMY
jgi:hypothetical protein